ncbi:glycosyltransferase family 2 protein [Azospirillum picis]|uniref:GT2 family glycosyltransferase n=1 Tax=Azospirillum picis TaxID=488438 RepID=A0ABU0MIH9_9PROT|nr:glycosyltransferase family 2 protein [Azospirillum picis]MBP2299608.1 GT2 family glycosyltransferase [Azospirillum picis]MDQ0533265.1 GT2 family glycosyltransferase [Azospirillum picis]
MSHSIDDTDDRHSRIIIVSFNCADFVNRVIGCLLDQTDPAFEVVIVDNASKDVDGIMLPDDPRFRMIRLDRNVGFAAANNIGAAGARVPWIVTLNPDAFPRRDWMERLQAAARAQPDVAMFGSTQLFSHDPRMVDGEGDQYSIFGFAWRVNYRRVLKPPYYSGDVFSPCAAAAMYRRDQYEAVSGFDEDYFCYCEDVDLGFRIRLRGGPAVQVGDAVVEHVSSGVSKQYGTFAQYHGVRNLIWTMVKNMPLPLLPLAFAGHSLLVAYLAIRSLGSDRTGAIGRGIRDALRGLPRMIAKRRAIQRDRRASLAQVARMIAWNPLLLKTRGRPSPDRSRRSEQAPAVRVEKA